MNEITKFKLKEKRKKKEVFVNNNTDEATEHQENEIKECFNT